MSDKRDLLLEAYGDALRGERDALTRATTVLAGRVQLGTASPDERRRYHSGLGPSEQAIASAEIICKIERWLDR